MYFSSCIMIIYLSAWNLFSLIVNYSLTLLPIQKITDRVKPPFQAIEQLPNFVRFRTTFELKIPKKTDMFCAIILTVTAANIY